MSVKVPESFDMECDVVVAGYGAAGAAAAITAHDNGAKVIVLEKMPTGGGNSRVSGGNIMVPKSINFAKYLKTISFGTTEPEVIDTFVENAMKNGDWIKELGGDFMVFTPLTVTIPATSGGASFPNIPDSEQMMKYNIKGTAADGPPSKRLWDLLSGNVERRGIKVALNTPAKELIQNDNGEIVGVRAEKDGKSISVKAKRAVILTCGGFEYNEPMKLDNLPCKPIHAHGNPGNTGDGIRMAQKVGADIWHMPYLSCSLGFKVDEFPSTFPMYFPTERFIYVDKYGKRFVDEAGVEIHEYWRMFSFFDIHRLEYPRIPMHAIFDDAGRRAGSFCSNLTGFNRESYKWSPDNSKEVEKGWVKKGTTIAQLAKEISVDESALEQTVAKYNEDCKAGTDTVFGRARENLAALDKPPYYALKLWPALINTQGGPRRNKEAMILDTDGKPIPRLYSAGELGSIWGFLYQGSTNVGECLVFGRIAGKNAAADEPWS